MPSTAGLLLAAFLGSAARRIQVQIIGKTFPNGWARVPGYAFSVSAFIGGYLVGDHFIERNRELLQRRLTQLREQRAAVNAFHQFDLSADHRYTAEKRTTKFFELMDKYGQDYK